jgi:hypothetical protein
MNFEYERSKSGDSGAALPEPSGNRAAGHGVRGERANAQGILFAAWAVSGDVG